MKKKAIVSVINDLVTDQRVHRTCMTLTDLGFRVVLVGRKLPGSLPLDARPYALHRMRLLFRKGPAFYIEYTIRLFLYLIFHRAQLLVSNDLDTLLPNYLVSKIYRTPLVFDSHEYFTGVPELQKRPLVRSIWKTIERCIFPRLAQTITVNNSIAGLFEKEYGKKPLVVRNIPRYRPPTKPQTRENLRLPSGVPLLLLQGSGINVQRGAEEAVQAMQFLPEACLLVIGGGDVLSVLYDLVNTLDLEDRVFFLPKMPYEELIHFTATADIGLSLDKGTNINYQLSLPNKLFDYIQARIPILASDLPEVGHIVRTYQIGEIIESHDPKHIAEKARGMFSDLQKMDFWKERLNIASEELCWENEELILRDVFLPYT